ncbi:MAG TPA: DUF47 family protein [bacterium]|nr:DUF47 family protein [bacterium]
MKFSFFNIKKNGVYTMIEKYLSQMEESIHLFDNAVDFYFKNGIVEKFQEQIAETHLSESKADDIRREIELSFYEKSLIPESRADILGLIESTDRVFNKAQSVLYQIETQKLNIPHELQNDFAELIKINISAYRSSIEGFKTLFVNIKKVREFVKEVDMQESSSDRKERDLIRKIFASGYETGQKILLKELIIEIGQISDLSEEVTDSLNIIAVKRMI